MMSRLLEASLVRYICRIECVQTDVAHSAVLAGKTFRAFCKVKGQDCSGSTFSLQRLAPSVLSV